MRIHYRSFALVAVVSLYLFYSVISEASPMPPNDLDKEDFLYQSESNISEEQFLGIIKKAVDYYSPLAKLHGGTLHVDAKWEDPTVNAMTGRIGPYWMLFFMGGFARRPEITPDGFALVVCHELGHLFGGYPFRRNILGKLAWASNEGESDYFATQSCTRTLWAGESEENAKHVDTASTFAKEKCDEAWAGDPQRHLCYRIANASQSVANLFAVNKKLSEPRFETPDNNVVKKMSNKHPAPQCRLDTYFEGALCANDRDIKIIPGKKYAGYLGFFFNRKAETQMAAQSCAEDHGFYDGSRPQCWFKSRFR